MKSSLSTKRKKVFNIPGRKMLLIFLSFCLLLLGLSIHPEAHAVMPPEHYEKMAQSSAIKAIAVIKDISILSKTLQRTHKKVVFTLEKPFEENIPKEFTGTCYSVDHKWQEPGVGGTIYYYPVKGTRVLVTVIDDHNSITSLTTLNPELEREITINGLTNISFVMGHAKATSVQKQNDKRAQWFLFYLEGKASGYLRVMSHSDRLNPRIIQFDHELLVGELDSNRRLFRTNTRCREDGIFTPEWITIQTTDYSSERTITHPEREIGFRPVERTDITGGILVKGRHNAYDISIPPETTTDFGLFTLAETLPYEKDFSLRINLIETLELHLKKDVEIRYKGKDPGKRNLHMFSQTGRAAATYWLNDLHELIEVQWDNDKRFVRTTEGEATTVLQ